jgi:hypothetical protein
MDLHEVILKLPEATLAALKRVAAKEDVSVGTIVRDAINRDLTRREKAKTPIRADERLVAPLRALLADDFAYARDWTDLLGRLRQKGYRLSESGGGLIILSHETGQRLCKASELGYSFSALLRKFDAPFPAGHRHAAVLHRVRATLAPAAPSP